MRELTRVQARRIAVRAQQLEAVRPTGLVDAAAKLAAVQVDMTGYLAPSAEVVFWSRLGAEASREQFSEAVEDRELVEVQGFLRPAGDVRLYTAEMAAWPGVDPPGWAVAAARWIEQNEAAREQALQVLRSEGPLPAREIEADFAVDWRSSGWNDTKNIQMLLERLSERGEVAVSHREGNQRVWDLAERVFPDEPPVPLAEALAIREQRRLAALGVVAARQSGIGERVRIEGLKGSWRVDAALLETALLDTALLETADEGFCGRTALLSPLDRLVFDRSRMEQLFEFDYALEMYKPMEVRRWGYWALPVLHGDQLVGKVDAESDHRHGHLHVHAIHEDEPWSARLRDEVVAELESLGEYLGLEVLLP